MIESVDRKRALYRLAKRLLLFLIGILGMQALPVWGAWAGSATAVPEPREPAVLFRPHAGVGWASSYGGSGDALAIHAGGRLLFPAAISPEVKATFGIETTYLQLDVTGQDTFTDRFVATGIVLEMTLFDGFNMGIGTLGYVGVGDTDRNPFGLVTHLGWEPTWDSRVRPYVTMRSEWIFDRTTYSVLSLSTGLTLAF